MQSITACLKIMAHKEKFGGLGGGGDASVVVLEIAIKKRKTNRNNHRKEGMVPFFVSAISCEDNFVHNHFSTFEKNSTSEPTVFKIYKQIKVV